MSPSKAPTWTEVTEAKCPGMGMVTGKGGPCPPLCVAALLSQGQGELAGGGHTWFHLLLFCGQDILRSTQETQNGWIVQHSGFGRPLVWEMEPRERLSFADPIFLVLSSWRWCGSSCLSWVLSYWSPFCGTGSPKPIQRLSKKGRKSGSLAKVYNTLLSRLKQENYHEFKTILGYMWDPVSTYPPQNKQKEQCPTKVAILQAWQLSG